MRALAACLLLLLAGCASEGQRAFLTGEKWDVEAAAALPAPADPFLSEMRRVYIVLAQFEVEERDWQSVADYVVRIRQLSAGEVPMLRDLAEIDDENPQKLELTPLRQEISALKTSPGALLRAGGLIGLAQAEFDCWAEQADEGHQEDDIDRCRQATLGAVSAAKEAAQLPKDWVVVLPEEGEVGGVSISDGTREVILDEPNTAAAASGEVRALKVAGVEIDEAFGDARAASPLPARAFELLFGFGRSRIDEAGMAALDQALRDVRARRADGYSVEVRVAGYADAVGPASANRALSQLRAAAVVRALRDELDDGEVTRIRSLAFGERDLAVPTQEPEERNRRVVVLVR
ncbi:MAG: OmpA family protein [Pseudomonadota bacterium]